MIRPMAARPKPPSRTIRALMVSPAVILFASATRLLLICNYDTTNATTMAASGGVTGTLLGTLVPLLPPYLPVIALSLAIFRRWSLFFLAALGTALVSPAYDSASDGSQKAYAMLRHFERLALNHDVRAMWHDSRVVTLCAGVALIVAGACVFALLFMQVVYRVPFDISTFSEIARRPWLPAEDIVLRPGGTRVGYTVSTKDKWFIILNEDNRTIDYLRDEEIASRKVCSLGSNQHPSNFPLIRLQRVHPISVSPCTSER
jgi:hypothetical protein